MIQDLKPHFKYYFKERNNALRNKFYARVIYPQLDEIIKGVLFSVGLFKTGHGCMMYENLKQDIQLKVLIEVSIDNIDNIRNLNGFIFKFSKNMVLTKLERNNKINKIKELIIENTGT